MEDLNTLYDNTVEQNYDPALVENIKRVLEIQAKNGRPQSFEIYVDGLRVVPRTTLVESFDLHKGFIHNNTKRIMITVFKGIRTPNCTSHIFTKNQDSKENLGSTTQEIPAGYLSGVQVQQMINETIEKERLNNRITLQEEKLQDKDRMIADRDKQLREADEYISKLQTGIESLKSQIEDKKSAVYQHLIDLVKNPPGWAQMMWMGKGAKASPKQLSGMEIKEDAQTEVVDLRNSETSLSEDDKRHLMVIRRMEEELDEDELHLLMLVNDKLIERPELLPNVAGVIDVRLPENQ